MWVLNYNFMLLTLWQMKDRNQQLILTLGRIQTKPRDPRVEYKTGFEPIAIVHQI